ncbi:MAG: TIGR02710 family CRISPR-associated protein [Candidatus Schekmanbacteria bacterium]|nr:TIGR02710 family CRISPR-associated protein [Candidatus Schekmanbacteria bacterium]
MSPPESRAPAPAAMILTVGGAPAPLIASIARQRPRKLIFLASPQTAGSIETDILPKLPPDYHHLGLEIVVTPSAELLDECYKALRLRVTEILERWGIDPADACVDFTGGTKVMSAAAVLAFADRGARFSYVGSADEEARSKGGVGVVIDGRERLILEPNPWQQLAEDRIRAAIAAFNELRFEAALALVPEPRADGRNAYAGTLRQLFRAIAAWDRQRYRPAHEAMQAALPALRIYADAGGHPPIATALPALETAAARLDAVHTEWHRFDLYEARPGAPASKLFSGIDGLAIPRDLCAAACRRARRETDPEDGVMLLYAAIEKLARGRLLSVHGVDNSKCPVSSLGGLREAFSEKHSDDGGVTVKLPLEASYALLDEYGDAYGKRYQAQRQELKGILDARNYCWREHGYRHVGLETFERLLPKALRFFGLDEAELVAFPMLPV